MDRNKAFLLLKITIVSIIAYALGALSHSEIMHFFLGGG